MRRDYEVVRRIILPYFGAELPYSGAESYHLLGRNPTVFWVESDRLLGLNPTSGAGSYHLLKRIPAASWGGILPYSGA
ncbi:hypothetical protein Hamer_G017352 [Homarus americanus]|uniref:Uncharacterized protein n=1 Tax=Homarus americanus TaxID=6706 RepID=A0A8J5JPD2_HOMAM|nr:hypothetical protein Hamer_G017352 [Homarus americanus]